MDLSGISGRNISIRGGLLVTRPTRLDCWLLNPNSSHAMGMRFSALLICKVPDYATGPLSV